jgi:hypothetical protein
LATKCDVAVAKRLNEDFPEDTTDVTPSNRLSSIWRNTSMMSVS